MNFQKLLRATLTICALTAGLISNARADFHIERGDTTGAPTLNMGAIYIDAGSSVSYDALTFEVNRVGNYQLLAMADFDSAIMLYEGTFDPSAPTTNLLWQNTNLISPDTAGIVWFMVPEVKYTVVVAGMDDNDFGKYSLTIGGPGSIISAVPEPSTWLMLGAGLAAVGFARRRATQS